MQALSFNSCGAALLFLAVVGSASAGKGEAPAFASALLPPDAAWHATAGAPATTRDGFALGAGNPAVLASETRWRGSIQHLAWASGFARERVGVGGPVGSRVALALDISTFRPSAPLPEFDELETRLGTIAPNEWSAGISLATALAARWAVGGGVRLHRLEDADTPAQAVGLSVGVRWRGARRAFGISALDLGHTSDARGRSYPLPTVFRGGMEQSLGTASTAWLAAEWGSDGTSALRAGLEYAPAAWMALLAGAIAADFPGEALSLGLSGGVCINAGRVVVTYAARPNPELGLSHQVGVDLGFVSAR